MNSSKYSWQVQNCRKGMALRAISRLVSKRWSDPFHDQDHILKSLFKALVRDVASPLAVAFNLILDCDSDWISTIGGHYIDPLLYDDPISYKKDAQMVNFVKKLPGASSSSRQAALQSFIDAERQCASTNEKFDQRDHLCDPLIASMFHEAKSIIADILGEVPDVVDLDFQFGPGATFSVSKNTDSIDKLSSSLELTPTLRHSGTRYLESCPGWWSMHLSSPKRLDQCITIQPGDRLATVPKTRKTDRPIAIGPTVNLLIQKGYGGVLRKRFRKYVNLDTAQTRHRRLAQIGSISGDISTIDLSSASDTIALNFVKEMLPQSWYNALFECRSARYLIEDSWYAYNKFSAMGNGYTFELESILFYSLALAAVKITALNNRDNTGYDKFNPDGPVSVFGDDIIIPTNCYDNTVLVLEASGFSVNTEKSFSSGFFRESCGGDYFDGIDTRSFYLKRDISFQSLFLTSNWLQNGDKYLYPRFWKRIRAFLGKDVLTAFSGRYNLDGSLWDPSSSQAPRYVVQSHPRYAKMSKPTWNHTHLANALYRQMHKVPVLFLSNQTMPFLERCVDKKRMRSVPGFVYHDWL